MLHYKRFLFLLNNDKCVFIKKKLHEKNNTAISHVAFFNHLDLQHQFKRFNSQNPNGPNWVPFVFFPPASVIIWTVFGTDEPPI